MPELLDQSETRIAAKIPPAMRAAIDTKAKRHGVSASAVLRWALTAYFPELADGHFPPEEKAS